MGRDLILTPPSCFPVCTLDEVYAEQMSKYLVREDAIIAAPAQTLFDIVADPHQHPTFDGSGTVRSVTVDAPDKLSLGSSFSVGMKLGVKYPMTSTVVEYEEGRRIAWQPSGGQIWRYTFTPVDEGTLVSEEWDARNVKQRFFLKLAGFPKRNRRGIIATLRRLSQLVEPGTASV